MEAVDRALKDVMSRIYDAQRRGAKRVALPCLALARLMSMTENLLYERDRMRTTGEVSSFVLSRLNVLIDEMIEFNSVVPSVFIFNDCTINVGESAAGSVPPPPGDGSG
eukprot:scaffold3957_cov157-Pinguiococcus_pyrenoidosus.AAC.2